MSISSYIHPEHTPPVVLFLASSSVSIHNFCPLTLSSRSSPRSEALDFLPVAEGPATLHANTIPWN